MSAHLISLSLFATLPSSVDTVRDSLAAKSDCWFHWLVVSSVVVGLGVAFEAWEATVTLKRWFWVCRDKSVAPVNEKSWSIPASYLGLVLVIAGVAGEGVFESLASSTDTSLRAHDEQVLAETVKQAGTAKESADAAKTAAELAKKASGEAIGKADTASITASKAGESASGALTLAGDAKAEVATVQSSIAKVDEKYAPRTLSKIKRDILIELLTNARPKAPGVVSIAVSADVPDGPAYALEIANAFNDPTTGWKATTGELYTPDGGANAVGVLLLIPDATSAPLWASSLQQALNGAGIGGIVGHNHDVSPGLAKIIVCRKN
jgi:hypothetical protein